MSIATYAFHCKEATKLRDKGIEIYVDEGNDQLNITREDIYTTRLKLIKWHFEPTSRLIHLRT